MDIKNFIQSKHFKIILAIIGGVVVALLIFQAGVFVGYRKAGFAFHMGDNYYRTFGPRGGPNGIPGFPGEDDFPNSHGAIGKIVKIELPTLLLESRDGIEKTVVINKDTIIRQFRNELKPENLKINDFVIVIGSPNNKAQVEARIIRIVPAPPDFIVGTSTKSN
jgi:hypothetical protein